jgi:excisionase family DNA binding protein
MDKLLLKPTEVAEVLRIGRSLVYGMLASGQLPSIRVGRCIRVPSASLEDWLKAQEKGQSHDGRKVG